MKAPFRKILPVPAFSLPSVVSFAPRSFADLCGSVPADHPKGVKEALEAGGDVDKKNKIYEVEAKRDRGAR